MALALVALAKVDLVFVVLRSVMQINMNLAFHISGDGSEIDLILPTVYLTTKLFAASSTYQELGRSDSRGSSAYVPHHK